MDASPADGPRIVSLAPNLTEILFAIGAARQVVGRTSVCDYPPEVSEVPVVGDFGRPSMERLLAVRPAMVVVTDLEDKTWPERLQRFGIRVRRIACSRLEEIPTAIRELGRLAGTGEVAERVAVEFEAGLAVWKNRAPPANRPRVFVEIWHDPLVTSGRRSFLADIVRLAGGEHVGDVVDREYFEVSPEWILQVDPDVILAPGMDDPRDALRRMAERPGWDRLRAVREGRVITEVPADWLYRPGPRALLAVEALARALEALGARGASP